MNTRFFFAVLIASIVAFLGGWLIFGILFGNYYEANTNSAATSLMKEPMQMWAIALANIALALLITWVLQKTGSETFAKGFATGLWISFLVSSVFDLSMFAFWDIYSLEFLIVDMIISSVLGGVVGGVSGAVLGSRKKVEVKIA